MKNLFAILAVAAASLTASATDYSQYYTNLPVELAQPTVATFPDYSVNITDFGAKGDAVTLNTNAFVKAIEAVNTAGGGHVIVPAGVWLTGPIELKSNVDLHLERNAVVYFSPDKELYIDPSPKATRVKPCITADKCSNIGITGYGTIDGNGANWRPVKVGKFSETELSIVKRLGGVMRADDTLWYPWDSNYGFPNIAATPEKQEQLRNDLFRVYRCNGILLQGVTFQNSPKFHVHPFNSENIVIDGVTVRCPWNAQNGDGIDLSDCHRALIVNSRVDCGDDGLCLKSSDSKNSIRGCEDILMQDNIVYHAHGGFVIGSNDVCGIRRVVMRNCTMAGTDIGLRFKSAIGRGGQTENIFICGISMTDIIGSAILIECGYQDRPAGSKEPLAMTYEKLENVPYFTDIHISDVVCASAQTAITASGIEGLRCVDNITIDNSTIVYTDEATKIDEATATLTLTNVNLVKIGN